MKVLFIACVLASLFSCRLGENENLEEIKSQFYIIEPKHLNESIAKGETNVFIAIETRPEVIPASQQEPVDWNQADYLRIAEALHEFVWNETLVGWQLNKMSFALVCSEQEQLI